MLVEKNDVHLRSAQRTFSDDELLEAAEDLSAIYILSNIEGFSIYDQTGNNYLSVISSLPGMNVEAMTRVAGRRIFTQPEPEVIEPKHRTIAEFLAAKALARRIKEGLPINRVLSLLVGDDGGVLPDLRGVYAWLIVNLPEHNNQLISIDPYGAILYGASSQWPTDTKINAIEELNSLSERDPWFRASSWAQKPLGGLACPETKEIFEEILDTSKNPHLVSVILGAIQYGPHQPVFGEKLLALMNKSDFFYSGYPVYSTNHNM